MVAGQLSDCGARQQTEAEGTDNSAANRYSGRIFGRGFPCSIRTVERGAATSSNLFGVQKGGVNSLSVDPDQLRIDDRLPEVSKDARSLSPNGNDCSYHCPLSVDSNVFPCLAFFIIVSDCIIHNFVFVSCLPYRATLLPAVVLESAWSVGVGMARNFSQSLGHALWISDMCFLNVFVYFILLVRDFSDSILKSVPKVLTPVAVFR